MRGREGNRMERHRVRVRETKWGRQREARGGRDRLRETE